ncbi:hypothetical protein DL98DRAFT_550980 [Cadophora sp. DSE1049]|nr:hypothetical protein DL98DRAFT_550980 [Cadophora sp. DSE1049]
MTVPPGYVEGFVCSLATCDVKIWGYVHYQPTLIGNALFLVIIDIVALAQLFLGCKYHASFTWVICMLLRLASESTGYIARVLLHANPFSRFYFLMNLICLTIGPAFIAAPIYLCLGRIVVIYGAVGGGIAASFPLTNQKMIDLGTHILVAGLSFQVASLFVFSVCSIEFLIRVKRNPDRLNPEHADLYNSRRFKIFLGAVFLATACLFVRTVFRSVELSEGFSGELANNEIQFMVLDGVMVIIACLCLTVMHPGIGVGKQKWKEAEFSLIPGREIGFSVRCGVTIAPPSP